MTEKNSPLTPLELQSQTSIPTWGSRQDSEHFVDKTTRKKEIVIDGQRYISEEAFWDVLNMFKIDIRLSNLSHIQGETPYVRYYLDLASDMLASGFPKASMGALSRAVCVMETSQAKGGFFRRSLTTQRQEIHSEEIFEPKKKTLWGKKNE